MTTSAPLLSMTGISKHFGATKALAGVDLELAEGEVLALVGENGAGKSTLMKVLSGALQPDRGQMQLAGVDFQPRDPHAGRLAGVAMIYQELALAPDLSVEDNVMLGIEHRWLGLLDRRAQRQRVRAALDLLGHPELQPTTPVRRLSVGAQQLVEIARALVIDARVVVFDEPTSSLARRDVDHLFEVISRLRTTGRGIIYISHFLEEIREVADRVTVLRDGRSVGSGELERLTDSEIVSLMVGRDIDELFPKVPHEPGEVILSLDGLSGERKPQDVSLTLRRGEILGIAGLVGAGRTELLRCLFGLDAVRSGRVRVTDQLPSATPRGRIQAGLGLVSEDRKDEGLALSMSIADNAALSRMSQYSSGGLLNLGRRNRSVEQWMRRLNIRARSVRQSVDALSGGNQQKVAIARLLHQEADVLLLDEPTRGIDVATKSEIYRLIGEQAAAGRGVLFVSSYLPELMAVCDRIGVMSRGRLQAVRPTSEWTEEQVIAAAIGSQEAAQ